MLKCHILFDAIKLAFTKYTEFLLLIIKLENSSILKCANIVSSVLDRTLI